MGVLFEGKQVRKHAKLYTLLFYYLPYQNFPTDFYKDFPNMIPITQI